MIIGVYIGVIQGVLGFRVTLAGDLSALGV